MKNIYFIDNESIKRTAKNIQKDNQKIKYTVILDDLSKVLGYDSYNQYEHYLTNLILSKDTKLNDLKVLTKIDSIELLLLEKKFILELSTKGYVVSNLYFINRIIDNQKYGYVDHSYLNLYAYMYFLPLIFNKSFIFQDTYKIDLNNGHLTSIITGVVNYYESIDLSFINELTKDLMQDDEIHTKTDSNTKLQLLSQDLKTRGIYYYIKSIVEDFEYDEGILTMLILKGYNVERIEHEINVRLKKIDERDKQVPVFFKVEKELFTYNYFPFIKSNITESKPFIFGKDVNSNPVYATHEELHSNIYILGLPGSGKTTLGVTYLFQMLMNNRGLCIINPSNNVYFTKTINYLANSLNKKNDIFYFNQKHNTKLMASSIHNEKIVLIERSDTQGEARRKIDSYELNQDYFEKIVSEISDYFFTAKFRSKKLPFYIFVEECQQIQHLSDKTIEAIKKLNSLNIFFIFDQQCYNKQEFELCDLVLISNSSLKYLDKTSIVLSDIIKPLENNKEIIGKFGPSKDIPAVFSLIYKKEFKTQVITDFDETLATQVLP